MVEASYHFVFNIWAFNLAEELFYEFLLSCAESLRRDPLLSY
jgi:hypothetical protein